MLASGCGLFAVRGPDAERPPNVEPQCTSDMTLVKADAGLVVAGVVAIIAGGLTREFGEEDNRDNGTLLILGGVGAMAAGYGSGYVGYRKVKACRKARDQWMTGQAGTGTSTPVPPRE